MSQRFANYLFGEEEFTTTEKGARATSTTFSKVYDLFARGGAMRQASADNKVELFKDAFEENPVLAMKCLFYIRDVRGGQGERQFFRDCIKHLHEIKIEYEDILHIIEIVPLYGRWDDLYAFVGTPYEKEAFKFMKKQFDFDMESLQPSLLAKWLKSENSSSKTTKKLGRLTRFHFGMSSKKYRQSLTYLRDKIKVVEKLMSSNRWDEIEFDKLPSKAGFAYRRAFLSHEGTRGRYLDFISNNETKINTLTLYPYEIIRDIINKFYFHMTQYNDRTEIGRQERATYQKFWDNLKDYFDNATFNGLAVIDTSGSMLSGNAMSVAVALGIYCAERAAGPFHNKFMSFSRKPCLHIINENDDIVDKTLSIVTKDLIDTTNLTSAFRLILKTAVENGLKNEDLPENLVIISDMQIDQAEDSMFNPFEDDVKPNLKKRKHEISVVREEFKSYGYELPKVVYWNVNASNANNFIDDASQDGVTYVSGCSPILFTSILTGKTGYDLMLEVLNAPRYEQVTEGTCLAF